MSVAIMLALVFCQVGASAIARVDDRAALGALADLYEENWAKFDAGRVWFEYTDAYAKTLDEAIKGNLTGAYKAEGFYAFKGRDAAYGRLFADEALVATSTKISENQVAHRFESIRSLTDGKVTLSDFISGNPGGRTFRSTIIDPGVDGFFKSVAVPLCPKSPAGARDDLTRTARLIRDGASGMELVSIKDEVVEGVKAVRIEIKAPGGTRVMWVDPERAAIPIRLHDEMLSGGTNDLHHGDIRHVPGRGWLPFERTYLTGGRVFRTVLTKVDFESVPDDAFRLEFPEPVAVVDMAKNLSYRPQKVWDLAHLPASNSPGTVRLQPSFAAIEPAMPGERETGPPYFAIASIGVAAVVMVAGLWKWRRARAASSEGV